MGGQEKSDGYFLHLAGRINYKIRFLIVSAWAFDVEH